MTGEGIDDFRFAPLVETAPVAQPAAADPREGFYIDWRSVVFMRRPLAPDPYGNTAILYFRGGHVLSVTGEWDDLCRRFDKARGAK